jgi:hypothetical protein
MVNVLLLILLISRRKDSVKAHIFAPHETPPGAIPFFDPATTARGGNHASETRPRCHGFFAWVGPFPPETGARGDGDLANQLGRLLEMDARL